MKKVKLFGALACASMLLAGCGTPQKEDTSTSEPEGSTSEVPVKSAWTEEELETIHGFLTDDEDFEADLPFAHGLVMEEVTKESTYLKFVGDKVTLKELEAYGEKLCNDTYGFTARETMPQDVYLIEDFEEDSVLAFEQDWGNGHWYPNFFCSVAIGQEAKTKNLMVIATVSICGAMSAELDSESEYIQTYSTKTQAEVNQIMGYDFIYNAYMQYIESISSQSEYNQFKADMEEHYVTLACAAPEGTMIHDYQYSYPFTMGNAYDGEFFHGSSQMFVFGVTEEETNAYIAALTTAGYALVAGSDWEYEKVADYKTDKIKFTLGAKFLAAEGEGSSAIGTCFDFEIVTEESAS